MIIDNIFMNNIIHFDFGFQNFGDGFCTPVVNSV